MISFFITLGYVVWAIIMVLIMVDFFGADLVKKFDTYMARKGRKVVLVDALGNEVIHRYVLFRKEDLDLATRVLRIGSPPQAYLHHFVWEFGESPDGPSAHSHLGTTISLLLRGWYKEWYKGRIIVRRPGSINVVKWPEPHKITFVKKGTWSLFVRLRTQADDVDIIPEVCEKVCDHCATSYGQCFNTQKRFKYEDYKHQFDSGNKAGIKFPEWRTAGPELDAWVARRRRAVARLGLETPVGAQEQLEFSRRTSKLPIMLKDESDPCRK